MLEVVKNPDWAKFLWSRLGALENPLKFPGSLGLRRLQSRCNCHLYIMVYKGNISKIPTVYKLAYVVNYWRMVILWGQSNLSMVFFNAFSRGAEITIQSMKAVRQPSSRHHKHNRCIITTTTVTGMNMLIKSM